MGRVQQAATAEAAPLQSSEQLLRNLERQCTADGAAYAIERAIPCAEQRARYTGRALALLGAPAGEQRNIGVKLIGLLGAAEHHGAVVDILEDRTRASWIARLFGGDLRQVGFIRRNALVALARLGVVNDRVEGALLRALSDPYYEARAEAANAISALGRDIAGRRADLVAALERRTADRSIDVACAAAEALGAIGDRDRALPALLGMAEARFWRVRMAALDGLRQLAQRGECDDWPALERGARRFVLASTDFQPQFQIKRAYGSLLATIAARKGSMR